MRHECRQDPAFWHPYKVPWWRVGPLRIEIAAESPTDRLCKYIAEPGDVIERVLNTYLFRSSKWRYRLNPWIEYEVS